MKERRKRALCLERKWNEVLVCCFKKGKMIGNRNDQADWVSLMKKEKKDTFGAMSLRRQEKIV